ncbi:Crossover junction endodeoxyribonuclease RuvC [BD1-7 clade bacterium]|uniref:Crossover junction endodeoxyribonuclease RuvC n=1 Tax=BD1-7 clade bacterium TaxID=2029982 RepID=A0A5S9MPP8_9GAMM|nr:Crossover junction endodeoxyribonuclease RuvC [BD1-7 clade bacterium]CAA0084932.1 Crossover junction endodeoxyribonuclease RuvC [BD1-7 clade bacterium]
MTIVLGIDPGSRKTGFGVVHSHAGKHTYIASGVIRVGDYIFAERLRRIYESLQTIIEEHCPQIMVVEQVFMSNNANSALKLGQARGAAITAGAMADLRVEEYSARQIKQAVVGTGAADKHQVQHMVKHILKLSKTPQEDAADALAAALCHIHTERSLIKQARSLTPAQIQLKRYQS